MGLSLLYMWDVAVQLVYWGVGVMETCFIGRCKDIITGRICSGSLSKVKGIIMSNQHNYLPRKAESEMEQNTLNVTSFFKMIHIYCISTYVDIYFFN